MKQISLSSINKEIVAGIQELCKILKVTPPRLSISQQSLEYLIAILRERRDIPGFFPLGKDVTINALSEALESEEAEIKDPVDRVKVSDALALIEEGEFGSFEVRKYSYDNEWNYEVELFKKESLDFILKRVQRVKREKPYESSTSVYGKCEINGLQVSVRDVGKCEVVYEEYEEEVDEMVPSGKKVKVKRKRTTTTCPDNDITNKKSGRRVTA